MIRTCPTPKAEIPKATPGQVNAIVAVSEARGIGQPMLRAILQGRYGCEEPAQLSMLQASRLLKNLMTIRRKAKYSISEVRLDF